MKKVTVRIMTAPIGSWYEQAVGEYFEVYDRVSDWVIAADYDLGHGAAWRHIAKADCFEVDPQQDTPSLPKQEGEKEPLPKLIDLWQAGNIPDFSKLPQEDTREFIEGFLKLTGGEFLKIFVAFCLKDGIEAGIINEPTGERFVLSFKKEKPYSATAAARKFERLIPGAFGLSELPATKEQEPDNLQVLTEFIKSDPTIGELVDKSLAMGLAPTVEFVDKQEPDGPAGDIPSDITDWLVDKNPYAGYFEVSEAWHDGGIAMYRRNVSVLEKQNVRILGHIKKRQDLESELSTANAQIEALKAELEQARVKIEEQKKWHDSHI